MNLSTPSPFHTAATPHAQRVLVVDDDPIIRKIVAVLLTRAGYAVDVAEDGEAGWCALNIAPYDLLITDHQMPRLSGMELIWRMHAAGLTLPVIMISGLTCVEVINPAKDPAPWFEAFIQKPFGPRELCDTVTQVLGRHNHADPVATTPTAHEAVTPR